MTATSASPAGSRVQDAIPSAAASQARRLLHGSRTLAWLFMLPALVMVVLFFLAPVVLTAAFSFTDMSTATGISGGVYQVAPNSILRIKSALPDLADQLSQPRYVIDQTGLDALAKTDLPKVAIEDLAANHKGEVFDSRRDAERMIKTLKGRPSTRVVKQISEQFNRSIVTARFATEDALFAAIDELGIETTPEQREKIAESTWSGWVWTTDNFERMFGSPDTARIVINTVFYVALVLVVFNTTYAMVLAIATHYMPDRPAGFFRALWLLPRITPPVIYVLMWKWVAWDTGFLSMLLAPFGVPPRNWLLDTGTNAWVFVILINGFVGASMGMLVFASALRAIPQSQFWASEVDGASRWQQIVHILLPQLRWPILFITCYQTLSLLASYDLILLATNGGPGGSTEVWSLAAYHTALKNYAGNLEYGYGAAMALALVIIGIVLALLYLRVFNYRTLVARPVIEN
jgi:inositol-phosphate transport system permease protein